MDREVYIDHMKDISESEVPMSLREHLAKNGVEKEIINMLLYESYTINLDKGDLYIPEYRDSAIAFLNKGYLREDTEYTESFRIPTAFVQEKQIIVGRPTNGNRSEYGTQYIARTPSVLHVIPGNVIQEVALHSSELFMYMLNVYDRALAMGKEYGALIHTLDTKQAMLSTLLGLFIWEKRIGGNKVQLTNEEVSGMHGCTRQYCSSIFHELIEKGIIKKSYGKIELLKYDVLASMVDMDIVNYIVKKYYYD